jgi:hypothetical protein
MPENSATLQQDILITMIGSESKLILMKEFDKLFVDGNLTDPKNGTPMEMDGYSVYLALKFIEMKTGCTLSKEKTRLRDAVLRRLNEVEPPFSHGPFTGSSREIHMRFSAAAVRLLGEAFSDNLLPNSDILVRALRYHFSFSERLKLGTWFLHDSLEMAATEVPYPGTRTKNNAWGSTKENNLVLNTHLDTLSTGILLLPILSNGDAVWLEQEIKSGLTALTNVLAAPRRIWFLFSQVDRVARAILFRSYRYDFWLMRRVRALLIRIYFPVRSQFRARWPNHIMGDGYLERDVSLPGTYFEYHLVNTWDLSRFAHQMRSSKFSSYTDLIRKCELIAERGIDYATCSSYWEYLIWSTRNTGIAIMLCEAILLRLLYLDGIEIPRKWLSAYCDLRRRVAPSPAILGYDPLVGRTGGANLAVRSDEDCIDLLDGRRLKINICTKRYEWC